MNTDQILEQQIIQYAKQHEPQEICGFVVYDGKQKEFIKCKNIADDPTEFFEIHPDDWLKAQMKGDLVAVVHSHPNGEPILSTADRQCQINTDLDWWLVCDERIHKFRNIEPLLGREFDHGTQDCYSLFRDAYMLSGVDFFDFNRENDWWKNGKNLYLENMAKNGFEMIDDGPKLGDVILIQINSDVPNHAAIYLGKWQQVLHHSPFRLSKRDLYDGYWFKHTHSIWRYKEWQKLNFTAILNDLALNSI